MREPLREPMREPSRELMREPTRESNYSCSCVFLVFLLSLSITLSIT